MSAGRTARTVAYLGGRGSFSEEACQRFLPDCEMMPLLDFEAVATAVCQGSADVAILPIHNSIAGPIDAVLVLLAHPELRTIGEQEFEVRLHLLAAPEATMGSIREVASHKAALLQCAPFIAAQQFTKIPLASTAEAARQVADEARTDRAAIASEGAAGLYSLNILARNIQGDSASITRFAIVERRDQFA